MKKKLLLRSLIGAPIGVVVSLIVSIIFSLCIGNGEYYPAPPELVDWCGSEVVAVIVQLLCSLFVGAVGGGSSVIWDMEKWSLSKQTAVHFAVLCVLFIPISYVLNWLPHHVYGAIGFVGAFILIYVIIWLSVYLSVRAKIKKVNERLREMQRDVEETATECDDRPI